METKGKLKFRVIGKRNGSMGKGVYEDSICVDNGDCVVALGPGGNPLLQSWCGLPVAVGIDDLSCPNGLSIREM
jgi:hypothetical protein